jgi:hypothetical protein
MNNRLQHKHFKHLLLASMHGRYSPFSSLTPVRTNEPVTPHKSVNRVPLILIPLLERTYPKLTCSQRRFSLINVMPETLLASVILGAGFSRVAGLPLTKDLFETDVLPRAVCESTRQAHADVLDAYHSWKAKNPAASGRKNRWPPSRFDGAFKQCPARALAKDLSSRYRIPMSSRITRSLGRKSMDFSRLTKRLCTLFRTTQQCTLAYYSIRYTAAIQPRPRISPSCDS